MTPNLSVVPTDAELPPHDPKSESCALGCVLAAVNSSADNLFAQLKLEHFYDTRHRTIFRALQSLSADNKHLDTPELDIFLRANQLADDCGGPPYYLTLADQIPSAWNFPTYFEDLEDLRVRRSLLSDASSLASLARDKSVPHKTLADASLRLLSAHSENSQFKLPPVRTITDLMTDASLVTPEQVVKGLIHKGSKIVLGSGAKARKTWTGIDLAVSVHAGAIFLGFETNAGRVLYINFELPEAFLKSRIAAVAKSKGVPLTDNLHVRTLRGYSAPLERLIPEFIRDAKKDYYSLIIIDPIYKGLGGRDENSAGDISELCNQLEKLAVATGAAVMFAAHYSKGNQASKDPMDRISGSGVFARDADTIINLTNHEQEGAYTVQFTLRNFPELDPFVVQWNYPLMERTNLDPEKLKGPKNGRPPTVSAPNLLEIIPAEGISANDLAILAGAKLDISARTTRRLRQELIIDGSLSYVGDSGLYFVV